MHKPLATLMAVVAGTGLLGACSGDGGLLGSNLTTSSLTNSTSTTGTPAQSTAKIDPACIALVAKIELAEARRRNRARGEGVGRQVGERHGQADVACSNHRARQGERRVPVEVLDSRLASHDRHGADQLGIADCDVEHDACRQGCDLVDDGQPDSARAQGDIARSDEPGCRAAGRNYNLAAALSLAGAVFR